MDDVVWEKIDKINAQLAEHDATLAVIRHELDSQRTVLNRQHSDIVRDISAVNTQLAEISRSVHEASGGLAVGRWLAPIAVAMAGVAATVIAFFKGGS